MDGCSLQHPLPLGFLRLSLEGITAAGPLPSSAPGMVELNLGQAHPRVVLAKNHGEVDQYMPHSETIIGLGMIGIDPSRIWNQGLVDKGLSTIYCLSNVTIITIPCNLKSHVLYQGPHPPICFNGYMRWIFLF